MYAASASEKGTAATAEPVSWHAGADDVARPDAGVSPQSPDGGAPRGVPGWNDLGKHVDGNVEPVQQVGCPTAGARVIELGGGGVRKLANLAARSARN